MNLFQRKPKPAAIMSAAEPRAVSLGDALRTALTSGCCTKKEQ